MFFYLPQTLFFFISLDILICVLLSDGRINRGHVFNKSVMSVRVVQYLVVVSRFLEFFYLRNFNQKFQSFRLKYWSFFKGVFFAEL